jgi:antitoxin (DNA-binding transcriptional repressor) of toxin-antitoxin stability system
MTIVNIHEAKTHFSNGEEIIIGKSGKPVVKLIAIQNKKPKRAPGSLKGKIRISEDFDAPLPADLLEEFEGK